MIINIDGNDHKLNFGIKFIKQLDAKYKKNVDGMMFGVGLNFLVENLERRHPVVLAQGLRYAAGISEAKAEAYVDSLDEYELEDLFDNFLQKLKEAPSTRLAVKKMEENKQMAMKMMEQIMEKTGDIGI